MSIVKFRSSGLFGADERSLYEDFNSREFHPGELAPMNGDRLDMVIEKALCSPYPVSRVISRSSYRVTRTQAHIRAVGHDVAVIRYVRQGSAILHDSRLSVTAQAGDLLINRSINPLTITGMPGRSGTIEIILLLVPASSLCGRSDAHELAPVALLSNMVSVRIAASLLELLAEEADNMPVSSAHRLTENLIDEIRVALLDGRGFVPAPTSNAEDNFRKICDYIDLHYSDPKMSLESTAAACRISVRYICELFRRHDTTFATHVWRYRVERVREWLTDRSMDHHSISTLAYRAGFKSPAHLCQIFRRTYNCSPRDFRQSEVPVLLSSFM